MERRTRSNNQTRNVKDDEYMIKKVPINFSYDEEKLNALKIYLAQKSVPLEDELERATEVIYAKVVPQNVREFIEMKSGRVTPAPKRRKKEPVAVTGNENKE